MDTLLSEFETVSFVDPTCYANTKHLLQQRQYLANQPLIIDFEGVWDDESDNEEDQEVSGFNSFANKRRFSSEFNLYIPQQDNNNNNNNNNSINTNNINHNNNNNSNINNSITSSSFKPYIIESIPEENSNNNNNINNNNNNNSCIEFVNSNNNNVNNSLNNISIEKIKSGIESLHKSGHIKIPKVKASSNIQQSSFQQKRKAFSNEKKLLSISKTMKKNIIKPLLLIP